MSERITADETETEKKRTECEVCQMLMKEKHRNDYVWKVLCVCFLALAIVLAILYFTSGAIKTETNIKIGENTHIGNDVQNSGGNVDIDGNITIGGDNGQIEGTVTSIDYTPIICITVIIAVVMLIVGGIIIANHNKTDD